MLISKLNQEFSKTQRIVHERIVNSSNPHSVRKVFNEGQRQVDRKFLFYSLTMLLIGATVIAAVYYQWITPATFDVLPPILAIPLSITWILLMIASLGLTIVGGFYSCVLGFFLTMKPFMDKILSIAK